MDQDVFSTNTPPTVVTQFQDQAKCQNFTAYELDLSNAFRDTETTDNELVISTSSTNGVNVTFTDQTATISAITDFSGAGEVIFRATDAGGLFVEQTIAFLVQPASSTTLDSAICAGTSMVFNGSTLSTAGTYIANLTNQPRSYLQSYLLSLCLRHM